VSQFPKFKYHADIDPIVVHTEDEEKALGGEWKDSPADHGVITNPSAEQARQIKLDELSKGSKKKSKKDEVAE
jgi:hypothetical protein